MPSRKIIAAFDFDGTITTKDTLFDFIKFYHGESKLYRGILLLSPVLIAFNLGFIENSKAKEKFLSYFFKGESISKFNDMCQTYSSRIYEICRADALEKIMWHKDHGHEIVIVSASVSNWIAPWAKDMGFSKVLGTGLTVSDKGIITGSFSTPNCYGQEKVNRLKEIYPDKKTYILYAYGDSSGDRELLSLADYPTLYKR